MNCLICFEKFDDDKRAPLIVRQCGHSACQGCLQSLFDRALKYGEATIKCPFCNLPETVPPGTTDIRKVFPVNFLFVQNLVGADIRTDCDHNSKLRKFICIDPKCKTRAKFCFDCSRKNHANCQEGSVMEQAFFEANTNFIRLFDPATLFSKKEVKRQIDKQVTDLRNMLYSVADEIETLIQNEYNFIQKARNNSDFYLANSFAFSCEKPAQSQKIVVNLKSEPELLDFCSGVTRLLTVGIWEKINQIYDRIVVDNAKTFLSLNTDSLSRNRDSINKFLKTEQLAFADRSSHFPQIAFPFTTDKYVDSIMKFLRDTSRKFVERESVDFGESQKQQVYDICNRAIDDDSVPSSELKSYIDKRLAEKFPGQGHKWELEFLDKNYLRVGPSQFSYLIFSMQQPLSEAAFFN